MSNETLFLLTVSVDVLFITFAARRGTHWLFGTIAINLILVGIFGSKLISVFGLVTNAGHVFHACVFLATHFLIEKHEEYAGPKTIWFGAAIVAVFALMSQMTTRLVGLPISDGANGAITALFSFSAHIFFASILAYIFAQYINIRIYKWLKVKLNDRHLWFRTNAANIVSQLVDSLLFFSIAFFDLPGPTLVQTILVGWLIKSLVVSVGTPFLYLDRLLERRKV